MKPFCRRKGIPGVEAGRILWSVILFSLSVLSSCGKADVNNPIGRDDSVPQSVTITGIENVNGGAIIKYNVPKDNNVNYIEAVYVINGKETRKKGSFYTNTLYLDGFPDSKEYQISLYSVSFSEVRSKPAVVNVLPDTPPYQAVVETLDLNPVFGGIKVIYTNPTAASLRLTILEFTEAGTSNEVETIYTSLKSGIAYVRGLEAREYTFGIVARDRWQNKSDTVKVTATPWYEELADFSKFRSYPLPTDISYEFPAAGLAVYHTLAGNNVGGVDAMWNGETVPPFSKNPRYFFMSTNTSIPYGGLPASITIDLGQTYRLSRFVYWPRPNNNTPGVVNNSYVFGTTHVKTFELWGSNDPSLDGSYDSWTKIGSFESLRPSGEGENTEEDKKVAFTGESFDMPEDIELFRYIRYKVFSTWGGQPFWASSELQFYGLKE